MKLRERLEERARALGIDPDRCKTATATQLLDAINAAQRTQQHHRDNGHAGH